MNQIIKEKRKEKGITQAQLAKDLGYSKMAISLIESGKMDIPISAIAKICKALDLDEEKVIKITVKNFEKFLRSEIKKGH